MPVYTFRPITLWPGPMTAHRRRAPFKSTQSVTEKLLERELRFLHAKNVVLQVALEPHEIRADGMPYARARPVRHPGVILAFDSKHGPLTYPCDTFDRWEDNLRAIALGLEHLRAVERYGIVAHAGQQYRGWTALPAPPPKMTREEAVRFLSAHYGSSVAPGDMPVLASAYRKAAHKLHPDKNPGDERAAADWKKLQEAKEVLGL